MSTIPYFFQEDYCRNFFNFSIATSVEKYSVEQDFVTNLSQFLKKLHVSAAVPIAESLFKRMADTNLFYHTPIHILSILQFALEHEIKMAWWEELTIWFHDAIYVPNAKPEINEWASSKFMESMLGPFIPQNRLTWISMAILQTSQHLAVNLPPKYNLIMDLDLSTFAFENPGRDIASHCVIMEFEPYYSKKEILEKRLEFLAQLMRRGTLYRSRIFEPFVSNGTECIMQQLLDTRSELQKLTNQQENVN